MGKALRQCSLSNIGIACCSNMVLTPSAAVCTGSILFTLSCSTGLFQIMANHSLRNRLCVAYPYAAGSLLYTWGAHSTMVASADALKHLKAQRAGEHIQNQAAILSQPAQVTPAVAPPEASAWEAPSGSRAMEFELFTEASDSMAHQLCIQGADCCSAMLNKRITTSPKTSQKARTSLETCRQPPALLIASWTRLLQPLTDGRLSTCSAHNWAIIDLTGKRISSCVLYPKHADGQNVAGQAPLREAVHCLEMVLCKD